MEKKMTKKLAELETSRLRLTSFSPCDQEAVFTYASNPKVARYTAWDAHITIADSLSWIEFVLGRQNNTHGQLHCPWAIRRKENETALGCITFSQTSESKGRIDYVLSESEWKSGLMTEAASQVLTWVFSNVPEIDEIESGCLTENIASCALLGKCGMTRRKTEHHHFEKFGSQKKGGAFRRSTRGF